MKEIRLDYNIMTCCLPNAKILGMSIYSKSLWGCCYSIVVLGNEKNKATYNMLSS